MIETPLQTINVGTGTGKIGKIFTETRIFFFFIGFNIFFLFLAKYIPGGSLLLLSIGVGLLSAWIVSLNIWVQDTNPWTAEFEKQQRAKIKDSFEDDPTVPKKITLIASYSKRRVIWGIIVAVAIICGGLIFLTGYKNDPTIKPPEDYLFATDSIFIILAGILMLYIKYREIINKDAQIAINEKGIEVADVGFYAWPEISNVRLEGSDRKIRMWYLIYYCPAGRIKVNITDFDMGEDDIMYNINVYRGRCESSK
jgi:hypothetical protein